MNIIEELWKTVIKFWVFGLAQLSQKSAVPIEKKQNFYILTLPEIFRTERLFVNLLKRTKFYLM